MVNGSRQRLAAMSAVNNNIILVSIVLHLVSMFRTLIHRLQSRLGVGFITGGLRLLLNSFLNRRLLRFRIGKLLALFVSPVAQIVHAGFGLGLHFLRLIAQC